MVDDFSGGFIAGAFIAIIISLMVSVLFLGPISYNTGFKEGQIDALTGNVKYELIINPDSTRSWERIDK